MKITCTTSSRARRVRRAALALAGTTAVLAASAAGASAAVSPTIQADYDAFNDTTVLHIINPTGQDLTQVHFHAVGTSGLDSSCGDQTGLTGDQDRPDVLAGTTDDWSWSDGGGAFSNDWDDYYGGAETITVTAKLGGQSVAATFSPNDNQTGSFVGFLGNDANGCEDDSGYSATVATLLPADTTAPSCGTLTVAPGGGSASISPSDSGSGIASITNVKVSNGTFAISPFSPGAPSATLTVTKTNAGQKTVFRYDVTDVANNVTHCS